jgi:hypothetical protein
LLGRRIVDELKGWQAVGVEL